MVTLEEANGLLSTSLNGDQEPLPDRDQTAYRPLHRFDLATTRSYRQQFGDMYFLRLAKIKPTVEKVAAEVFGDVVVGGEAAKKMARVLDVRQGELCWVVGTVYMDMPYKPNILIDVSIDKLLSKPSDVKKYIPEDLDDDILAEGRGSVAIMLEDDSGRIRLVGSPLRSVLLVTGCIIAVMGTENEDGHFEVLDIVFADLPPQPDRWQLGPPPPTTDSGKPPPTKRAKVENSDGKHKDDGDVNMDGNSEAGSGGSTQIAIVSGLNFAGPHAPSAVPTNLLLEFLLGEALVPDLQMAAARISRLIIAGNSVAAPVDPSAQTSTGAAAAAGAAAESSGGGGSGTHPAPLPQQRKYGYDSSTYNPVPSALLDEFLAELLPSMPVTLLPGLHDPSNASLPQQPVHAAMFPQARVFAAPTIAAQAASSPSTSTAEPGWFDTVTNPWEGEVAGWRFLGTSGQTIDDIHKYLPGNDRLSMMEATCRWRCCAPTAPDTLWSYPYQEDDPFVLDACPHLYFVGSQPEFGTRLITGPTGQTVRLIAVPAFSETGEIVLIDTETLDVTQIKIGRV
ncbi:DNA polymerase delta subunit [Niveomyces insectorum RCEF 264]|uniref:DNA-directed DNA polymerase n=1 Tax=Niveomyces insectorum RCEF 264 TaxID=1081102 RepID=A0A167MFT7_9HYPO|nr:DNA polymerase delta subunit [Niveomyces insectorum RCEF 264]